MNEKRIFFVRKKQPPLTTSSNLPTENSLKRNTIIVACCPKQNRPIPQQFLFHSYRIKKEFSDNKRPVSFQFDISSGLLDQNSKETKKKSVVRSPSQKKSLSRKKALKKKLNI